MSSAAERKALLLEKRENERLEQERRDAEIAAELERLEQQEEEERVAKEAEERRVREEREREEQRAQEEARRIQQQQQQTDEELRLATPEDRIWMMKVLAAKKRGELVFQGNVVTAHVGGTDAGTGAGNSGGDSRDGECWPCRVREIECERRG
jgi:hypothetical protein